MSSKTWSHSDKKLYCFRPREGSSDIHFIILPKDREICKETGRHRKGELIRIDHLALRVRIPTGLTPRPSVQPLQTPPSDASTSTPRCVPFGGHLERQTPDFDES